MPQSAGSTAQVPVNRPVQSGNARTRQQRRPQVTEEVNMPSARSSRARGIQVSKVSGGSNRLAMGGKGGQIRKAGKGGCPGAGQPPKLGRFAK